MVLTRASVPRVVFLGMDSEFSTRPLRALVESGVRVEAVVKPMGGTGLRRTNVAARVPRLMTRVREHWERLWTAGTPPPPTGDVTQDPFALAEAAGIPCYLVGDASGEAAWKLLKRHKADLYCVAFFNQLLRPNILALPRLGTINLHPSLLPLYRGPSPLFWVFRDAVRETGLTLHRVSEREDDGDIVEQVRLPLPDGTRGHDLLHTMSLMAADMLVRNVWALFRGEATPTPQDNARATRHGRPGAKDCELDFSRGARAVFNLVRGAGSWMALHARVGHDVFEVVDAEAFEPGGRLPRDVEISGTTMMVQCPDGVVVLRLRGRQWTSSAAR